MREAQRNTIGGRFQQFLKNCGGDEGKQEEEAPANTPLSAMPSNNGVTAKEQEGNKAEDSDAIGKVAPTEPLHASGSPSCADKADAESKNTASCSSPPEKQPDKPGDINIALVASISKMPEQLAAIQVSLQNRTAIQDFVNHQGQTLKMMSERLRTLEDDFVLERMMKPLFKEILVIYDDAIKAGKSLKDVNSADTAQNILQGIAVQILQMLERHGITAMTNTPDIFDPTCQKALAVVPIKSVKAGTVISREQSGFLLNGKVFRYEGVIIVGE